MKPLFVLGALTVLALMTSCSHHPWNKREISSEPEKYLLNTEAALKKIKELKVTPLSDSQCFADPETKIYLTNIKASATSNFKELKGQINVEKMENSASTEYYFCRVTCLLNNRYAAFWTTLTDSPNRHSDDNAFICQGITMEMVNIPGTSLSTLGPIVHNISAFSLKEILPRMKELDYKISANTKAELDAKLFATLSQIAKAYMSSTMPAMIEAGRILDSMATQKPGSKALLDKYALMMKNSNGQLKGDFSADYFVLLNLLQNGRHLMYEKM